MSVFSMLRRTLTTGKGVLTGLPADLAQRDPVSVLREWFEQAGKAGLMLPETMCLATSTPDGHPSARMVLLKEIGERSVVLYTNYDSRKGEELRANPRAAAVLHWAVLQRQIRIEGPVTRLAREESQRYFHSRDRGSQIGAWASKQSRTLESRAALERRERDMRQKFRDQEVPLPDFWGGLRIEIEAIEFWQGRANRLHDRMRFDWSEGAWSARRLYP